MSAADPVGLLSRVSLFSELSREELERISRVAIPRSFPAGVRVFHEGDRSDACYLVRTGDLRVTREHSDGRAIALATLGPGDIFGELAMQSVRRAVDVQDCFRTDGVVPSTGNVCQAVKPALREEC